MDAKEQTQPILTEDEEDFPLTIGIDGWTALELFNGVGLGEAAPEPTVVIDIQQIASLNAEIKHLHVRLAGETLRADQGWERYESANKSHMKCLKFRARAIDFLGEMARNTNPQIAALGVSPATLRALLANTAPVEAA